MELEHWGHKKSAIVALAKIERPPLIFRNINPSFMFNITRKGGRLRSHEYCNQDHRVITVLKQATMEGFFDLIPSIIYQQVSRKR